MCHAINACIANIVQIVNFMKLSHNLCILICLQRGGRILYGDFSAGKNSAPVPKIKWKIPHLPNLQCIGSKRDPGIAIPKKSWEKAMTTVPEITSVEGVARHSQIVRLPAPPSLLVDNNCRRAGTKQLGARGEAQGIRWYGGLHGQNSARGKFRTSPRKMRGEFHTKLKYGIVPAEKSPRNPLPRVDKSIVLVFSVCDCLFFHFRPG